MENPTQLVIDEVLKCSKAPYPVREFDYKSDGLILLFTSNFDFIKALDRKRIWKETGLYLSTSYIGDSKTSKWGRFLSVWMKNDKDNYGPRSDSFQTPPEIIEMIEAAA